MTERMLKRCLKEALAGTLHEQRDFLCEVFSEVVEDFALAGAILEGMKSGRASRQEVIAALQKDS